MTVSTRTNPKKILLNDVTGQITGGFWAIMGSSGGGKTTLLSTIALRLDASKIEIDGPIKLNGRAYTKSNLKAMSGYVLQDDVLHAELTVIETLRYHAQLRLAGKVESSAELEDIVEEVIDLMGIGHIKDVIIGDSRRKGVSGGERKRVCVGIELLTRPKLLFLDEPTSGLDSSTALKIIGVLKNITEKGICTVVCTIHQPQKKIFELFDNLILMKKGTIIYQGPCSKGVDFIEKTGFKKMPEGDNPADFLIECLSGGKDSAENDAIEKAAKLKPPVDLTMGSGLSFYSKEFSIRVWLTQYIVLSKRCLQQYIRRSDIIYMNLATIIIMSIFISFGTWYQIGNTQDSIAKRVPSLFFCCVCQGIVAALQCISSFPLERSIILRERAAGAYYVSAYFLAKSTVDILSVCWGPTIFCAIVYPSIGYQGNARKFFIYLMFMLLDSLSALSLATLVACACVSVEMSTVVLSIVLEITRLYGGFFISPLQMEDQEGWKFANALSYLTYSFMGVTVNELTDLKLTCTDAQISKNNCFTTGEQIMISKGYDKFSIGYCIGIGIVFIFGCRLFSFFFLRFNDK